MATVLNIPMTTEVKIGVIIATIAMLMSGGMDGDNIFTLITSGAVLASIGCVESLWETWRKSRRIARRLNTQTTKPAPKKTEVEPQPQTNNSKWQTPAQMNGWK